MQEQLAGKLAADELLNRERPVVGPGAKYAGASGFDGEDIPGWLVGLWWDFYIYVFLSFNKTLCIKGTT
jgi:hypothetical protein